MFGPSHPQQQHEMQLERTHPSGAEEWFCPTCGRRTLMQWLAEDEKLDLQILEPGDLHVSHVGSKDGLRINKVKVVTVDDEPVFSEELRLALEEALEDIDFDNWPDVANQ